MSGTAAVPLRERLVEVIADLGGGHERYGSGCVVAGATVLTAAHVVADALHVHVRGVDKRMFACDLDPRFVGSATTAAKGPDLAMVTIRTADGVDPPNLPPLPLARVDRDSTSGDAVERCHAWGYPQFAEVPPTSAGDLVVRETLDAIGMVPVGSGLVQGLLDLQVSDAPRDLPALDEPLPESPWSGISGGPVIARGHLLGVITEHAQRAGAGSLTVTPLTAISPAPDPSARSPGVSDPQAWWARLGVSGPDDLTVLPARPMRAEPAYQATLRSMGRALRTRMLRLEGRTEELAAITAFATGDRGYRWLVGDAFTGKSALMYHAVTAVLPDTVDVVCYFLRRIASDADSTSFLAAVIPQLSAVCDIDTPYVFDQHTFRSLWETATSRSQETGRHLMLVVDGLDEDLHPTGTPSVASLLPDLVAGVEPLAANVHVHVTSRPNPTLPQDLTANTGHPLTLITPEELPGFPGWEQLRDLGLAEIDQVVEMGRLARDVLGILAAAAGALTIADLASLTRHTDTGDDHDWEIEQLLTQRAARSLEPLGQGTSTRYHYAHATLLDRAQQHSALARPQYRQRLHAWADTWRDAGWPDPAAEGTGTPLYLLDTYPATLQEEPQRLARLASGVAWLDTAIRAIGSGPVTATLHIASKTNDADAIAVNSVVSSQAIHLQPNKPLSEPGYLLRHLTLQALMYGLDELATAFRSRLGTSSGTGPMPLWTSVRLIPPASELGRHDRSVFAVAVTAQGLVVSGGVDERVLLWDPDRPARAPIELGRHRGFSGIRAVAVTAQGSVITVGTDRRVLRWDPDRPGVPTELGHHDDWVHAVAVAPQGWVVTGGGDGRVLRWDPDRPGPPTELGRHERSVGAVAVAPLGWVVTGGDADGRVLRWDPALPGVPTELGHHDDWVQAVAIAPQGWVVTGGSDGRVLRWNADQPGPPTELGRRETSVNAVAVSTQGWVVTGDGDGRVLRWNADQPGPPTELGRHDDWVRAVAVAPQGWVVTGGDDRRVLRWDAEPSAAPSESAHRVDRPISAVAMSPQGWLVTGGEDGRVLRWDADRSQAPTGLGHHNEGPVWALAVAPQGGR